ncbi:MAG: hypothetical protein A2X36_16735 [Elusimicrobia bacterium GWA2_69_24]|nr:MAG: hypothetical protein A2X36_16735 [Elusimicrobia bacterium GWA2_69_24]HBL16637.1 hypothetical protein [Elusimicrobiota bacterium]
MTAAVTIAAVSVGVRAMCGHCGEAGASAGKAAHSHGDKTAAHQMKGCPSLVEGAEVKVTNTEKGVMIEITAKDPKAIKDIQSAAARMTMAGACPHCGIKGKADDKGAKKGTPANGPGRQ